MNKEQEDVAKKYKRGQVESATPGQLIILLYDGAIDYLKRAENALEKSGPECIEKFHNNLIAAQKIIAELTASLDMEKGGEIAENLFRLYDYMNHQLIEANMSKKVQPIHEVQGLLETLKSAWVDVIAQEPAIPANHKPSSGLNLQG